jgi:hypothetical protein
MASIEPISCCTCATLLSSIPLSDESEKTRHPSRYVECCGRTICGPCLINNRRFESYCPFCQISTTDRSLPPGLKDPPTYSEPSNPRPVRSKQYFELDEDEEPPAYSTLVGQVSVNEKASQSEEPAEDVLHFLHHPHDSIASLALAYNVPAHILRQTNNLWSEHLLAARRTLIIPGAYYKGGVSLSPRPVEGEEEESRKAKVRRFMVACKVAEYDVAVIYLKQADDDLDRAVETYKADERWEKEHPLSNGASESLTKGKTTPRKRRLW